MAKKCKKCPFEISFPSYKLIYVFIFPIFDIFFYKIEEKYLKINHEYFTAFLYYLSYLFSFIFIIIMKIINRRRKVEHKEEKINEEEEEEEEKEEENNENSNIEENNENSIISGSEDSKGKKTEKNLELSLKRKKRKKNIRKFLFIFIILLMCAASLSFIHFHSELYFEIRSLGMAYKIPLFFALSFFLLRYKYYRHHIITLVINSFTLISKYIITTIQSDNGKELILDQIWKLFFFAISYCLIFVCGKYYMNIFYRSPYFLMSSIGLIMSLILISIAIIKYLVISESQIFSGFAENFDDTKSFFILLGYILLKFIYNLGLWITTYYFTPCHTIISENILEIEYYFYDFKENEINWIKEDYSLNFWFFPIIHFINLFCSLIFNEIIILNFLNLDYYTKIRILERERFDTSNLLLSKEKAEEDEKLFQKEEDSEIEKIK